VTSTSGSTTARGITGPWVKSSYSGPTGGNCVEVAFLADGQVAMRNSRQPEGPALIFTRAEWEAFLGGARDGEFGSPQHA
jgi:hypothetical protein